MDAVRLSEARQCAALEALRAGKEGSELSALAEVAAAALMGRPILPRLQHVANLLVARSILEGCLPSPQKRGRPKRHEVGMAVTARYLELHDAGMRSTDAVQAVADEFHKEPRHIWRSVREYRAEFRPDKEGRVRERAWHAAYAEMGGEPLKHCLELVESWEAERQGLDLQAEVVAALSQALDASDMK